MALQVEKRRAALALSARDAHSCAAILARTAIPAFAAIWPIEGHLSLATITLAAAACVLCVLLVFHDSSQALRLESGVHNKAKSRRIG